MKTKDGIAAWLLVLFVLVPFLRTYGVFSDDLKLYRPVGIILWDIGVLLIVIVSGLFLFKRFVDMQSDLQRYESEEREREKTNRPIL